MNALIRTLKRGINKDTVRQARIRPTLTAKILEEKHQAMIAAGVKLEIAYDIVKSLLCDTSTFGDRQRAYEWLLTHRPNGPALQQALNEADA